MIRYIKFFYALEYKNMESTTGKKRKYGFAGVSGADGVVGATGPTGPAGASGGGGVAKAWFNSAVDYVVVGVTATGFWQDDNIIMGWDATNRPEIAVKTLPLSGPLIVHSQRSSSEDSIAITQSNYKYDLPYCSTDQVLKIWMFAPGDTTYPSYNAEIFYVSSGTGQSLLTITTIEP
jgi:hypothetical protein